MKENLTHIDRSSRATRVMPFWANFCQVRHVAQIISIHVAVLSIDLIKNANV